MEDFDISNILYFILILISLVAGALQQARKAKKIPKADPNERKPIDPMDELDDIFGKKEKEPESQAEEEYMSTQQVDEDYFEKMHRDLEKGSTIDREPTIDDKVIEGQISTLEKSPFYSKKDMDQVGPDKFKEATSIFGSHRQRNMQNYMDGDGEGVAFDLRKAIIYSEIISKPKAFE